MSGLTTKACDCGKRSGYHKKTCPAFVRFEPQQRDFVGVAGSSLVYVGVADRAQFDKLNAPLVDHGENENGHVLSKQAGGFGGREVTVVFQHWVKAKTAEASLADAEDSATQVVASG